MRLGVMGDTHGDLAALAKVVRAAGEVDGWLHTGDYSQDATYLRTLTEVPIYATSGNCDSYEGRAPEECVITLEGIVLAMTHGHKYLRTSGLENLAAWGRSKKAQVVIFGHTHVARVEKMDDLLILNPGSPTRPRRGLPSYAELYLETDGTMAANICWLD